MNYRHYLYYILLICLFINELPAQQLPSYSQYIMNGFLLNPSLAGRDGYTTVSMIARQQWMGIKGAPSTYAATFQTTPLQNSFISKTNKIRKKVSKPSRSGRVGIGGYLFNDNNGIIKRTGFQADYAYHVPMSSNSSGNKDDLAFGLGMVAYQHVINLDNLNYNYSDDPYLNNYDKSVFITDFNFGVSYATSKFYAGFAMTNILRGSLVFGNSSDNKSGELGHYYLTGGASFPINKEWSIKPSLLFKSSDMLFKSVQMDLTARVFYKEDYWAGVSYRTGDAIIALLGLKFDKFYLGYAYDFTLTDMMNQSIGTMELTLAAKFGESNARRYRWLNSY
ncbi:MAG TPA: type IX secretion system membrane protein PorP/SprF [Bacteroidales bacterium]|nr:type IX secretion system membrane protein PorP/SprF [Bacteroidales bacterium]